MQLSGGTVMASWGVGVRVSCFVTCMSMLAGVCGSELGEEVPGDCLQSTNPQSNLQLKELKGLWIVIEVIKHNDRYKDLRTGVKSASCPVAHFAIAEYLDEPEVRMIWYDEGGYIQYTFRVINRISPGIWMSLGFQSGTLVDNSSYEQFSGSAQVVMAVQTHMVLTLCSDHGRHFSIIMARNKYLSHDKISEVYKQLNLPLVAVESHCRNAGDSATPATLLGVFLALVLIGTKRVTL